jgi:hypothetical protein
MAGRATRPIGVLKQGHRVVATDPLTGRIRVDALGLIIAVVVTPASVTDTVIGVRLLDKVVEHPYGRPGLGRCRVQA